MNKTLVFKAGRRQFVTLGALAAVAPRLALAQGAAGDYPRQSIRMIVPFSAGGPTDILARAIGTRLAERLGQSVVIDNRAGAGGNIGADLAARAPADGYTLMVATAGILAVNPHLFKLRFDPLTDFAPISLTANLTSIMVVAPKLGVGTAKELIELAKERPGGLSYGSAGNGSASHLAMERFNRAAGVKIQHVPYKGAAPAVTDLLAGTVQVMLIGLPTVMPHVRAGRLKALGVSSLQPSPLAPGVAPLAQAAGLPGFEVSNWLGMVAPAGTPAPVIHKLNNEVVAILQSPEARDLLLKAGFEPTTSTPEEFASYLQSEYKLWGTVVKEAGIKLG